MWKLKEYKKAILESLIGIPFLIGGVLLMYLGVHNDIAILAIIGCFVGLMGVACPVVFIGMAKDKINTTCDECQASLKGVGCDFQLEDRSYVDPANPTIRYKYHIHCNCPKCGADKDFNKEIVCKPSVNPEVQLRKQLRALFK